MEDPLVRQPSSGTIISHNAHLLIDANDNVTNPVIDVEGHVRPASDSSQLSREMDASPIDDEGRDSKESLDEEARYQKELKDRVRRSYADLGMAPEGILLKDDDEEQPPHKEIAINEDLEYGIAKAADRDERSDNNFPENRGKENEQFLLNASLEEEETPVVGKVSPGFGGYPDEFVEDGEPHVTDADLSYNGDEPVENVTAQIPESRGNDLSNNHESNVTPLYESEDAKPGSVTRSRLSHQSKGYDQEDPKGRVSGGNPQEPIGGIDESGDRLPDDIQNRYPQGHEEDQLRDSLEPDHSRVVDNFRDSLDNGVPEVVNGIGEEENRNGHRISEEDSFRDSLEDQLPPEEPSQLNDGFHGNVNNNAQYGGGPPPVGSGSGRSYADVVQDQKVDNGYSEQGSHEYGNVNNNAQYGGGPPPVGSGSGRSYADVVQDQDVDNGYSEQGSHEYANDDVPHPYDSNRYPNEQSEQFPSGTATQEDDYRPLQANDEYHPSHGSQGNNAVRDNQRRTPPVPPTMPPEPPPPVLSKPASANNTSRPATNPFNVDYQQGGHQLEAYRQAPQQQNRDVLPDGHQLPSQTYPQTENGVRPPSKGPRGQTTYPESNPYHAEFLNQAATEQPLLVQGLAQSSDNNEQEYAAQFQDQSVVNTRAHPPPPPPQSQTFQSHYDANPQFNQGYSAVNGGHVKGPETQNNPPVPNSRPSDTQFIQPQQQQTREELQLSKSPLRVRESPRQESNPSRTPLHLRPQEKSYLDQFRDKQKSSDGTRQNGSPDPGRTSQRSNRNVQEREQGYAQQVPDRDLPVRTLESQKGFQGYGRNSRGSAPKEVVPQRTDDGGGSLASLESLRFQALPRENSQTKANHEEEKLIKTLPSGEMLHVAYISDDSDDEDMHFVDEMGNPVDVHGNLLAKSPSPTKDQTPKLEFRIKPAPPKETSASQTTSATSSAIKRRSSGDKTVRRGRELINQTAQVPSAVGFRRQNTTDKAVGDSKAPNPETPSALRSENTQTEVPVVEDAIISSTIQREGELGGTIPVRKPPLAPFKDPPPSSDRRMSSGNVAPLGDVMVTSLQGQPQYGYPPNVNPAMQMAYQVPQQFMAASQVQPGQVMLANQPAIISPSASYSFAPQMYAQLQPTVAMSPVQTILQPVMQHPQVYMGGPQFQPQFMPAQIQQGSNFYGAQQPGQDIHSAYGGNLAERGGPSQESEGIDRTSEGDEDGEDDSPQEDNPVPPESEQSGRPGKHPKGVRGLLADRNRDGKPKKKTPKVGKNFIDANKNNVKNLPPDKRYKDMYTNVKTTNKQQLNQKQPLPNISQDEEDSGEDRWAYREDARGYEEDEEWARQLVEEQRMMAALKRNRSDSNILERQANRRNNYPPGQGYNDPRGYGVRTFPSGEKGADGQQYSYSADRAVTYARMNGPAPRGYQRGVSFDDNALVPQDGVGRYGPRERFAYTHPMPARYSPYDILPDIPGEEDDLQVSDPHGYLMKMHKQRQPPAYKEYTVKDYRALKRDIKLGGLGPDPDLVHERQEKAQRQREYARVIMEQNKKTMKKPPKPWTPPKNEPTGQEKSKRGAALRYAKKVPRPPLRTPQEVLHGRLYGNRSQQDDFEGARDGAKTYILDEMAKLDELAERHRQEKEEIERLRSGHAP